MCLEYPKDENLVIVVNWRMCKKPICGQSVTVCSVLNPDPVVLFQSLHGEHSIIEYDWIWHLDWWGEREGQILILQALRAERLFVNSVDILILK